MQYKIKINNEWVIADPINGQMCQKEVAAGVWVEQMYFSPVPETLLIDIVVTSIDGVIQATDDFATTIATLAQVSYCFLLQALLMVNLA